MVGPMSTHAEPEPHLAGAGKTTDCTTPGRRKYVPDICLGSQLSAHSLGSRVYRDALVVSDSGLSAVACVAASVARSGGKPPNLTGSGAPPQQASSGLVPVRLVLVLFPVARTWTRLYTTEMPVRPVWGRSPATTQLLQPAIIHKFRYRAKKCWRDHSAKHVVALVTEEWLCIQDRSKSPDSR